jgi:Spy/CpxP family protein refolding chaperone
MTLATRTAARPRRRLPRFAIAALAALAAPALAEPAAAAEPERSGRWERRGPGGLERLEGLAERRAERLADALELTAEQRTAWSALRAERRAAAREQVESARRAGRELRALLDADAPDPRAVGERLIELHRLRADRGRARDDLRAGLEELLDAEQRARLDALETMRPGRRLRGARDELGAPGERPERRAPRHRPRLPGR